MKEMDDEFEARGRVSWPGLALLSTLSTVVSVHQAIRDRLSGQDPSRQEALSMAYSYLTKTAPEVRILLTRLRISLARPEPDETAVSVASVHRLAQVMMLTRVAHLMHRMHQRLMSLYPAVSEELVEAARHLHTEAGDLMDGRAGPYEVALSRFVGHGISFLDALHLELVT